MVDVDVVILTKSSSMESISMTKRAIITMQEAEMHYHFHFHLIESGLNMKHQYANLVDNYIVLNEEFNYNKFLNIGFQYVKHEWVVISNNDVGYERGWFTELMKIHAVRPDIHSFSPKDPMLYSKYYDYHFIGSPSQYFESYIVSEAVMGWCLVIKKPSLDKITPFDEQFDMYYQDNDYAMTIQKFGIKHALVRNSIACHLGTLKIEFMDESKRLKMEDGNFKFYKKWLK
jgi:GT2 family glycosyltransferase